MNINYKIGKETHSIIIKIKSINFYLIKLTQLVLIKKYC